MMRGRLAPSPTGYLHLGNARSFLLAWLQMRSLGGEIVLRIEDLDEPRAAPGAAEGIVRDLSWLGLDWDNELTGDYFQSARRERYREVIDDLDTRRMLYRCYCSRRELRESLSAPHGRTPRYSGRCRDRGRAEAESRKPALRLRVDPGTVISFDDLVRGEYSEDVAEETGDFIVARADGVPSYQLAVVVDDIDMGITHVMRGDDLLSSTPRQILLHHLLGAPPPSYAHVPLVLGPDGTRLAKRHGSISIAELRQAGHFAEEVVGWLAWSCGLTGTRDAIRPESLVREFSAAVISSGATQLQGLSLSAPITTPGSSS